jgi:hypothetical protein
MGRSPHDRIRQQDLPCDSANATRISLTTGSLYQWLQTRYGLTVAYAERNLEAVAAQQRDAMLLDIALYSPLLLLESVVYLPNGKPLEYSSTFHRGDRTRVSISFVSTAENQMSMSTHENQQGSSKSEGTKGRVLHASPSQVD